jgi:hypothetical protein
MSETVSLTEALRVTSEPRINGLTDDSFAPLGVAAMVHRVADMAAKKASHPWAFLMRSLVGGAMVAFGVVLSLVVSTRVSTAGVASLLMGLDAIPRTPRRHNPIGGRW